MVVNGYYIPTRGSITAAGGRGAAATWKGTVHYSVTGLTPGRTSYTAKSSGSLSGVRWESQTPVGRLQSHRQAALTAPV